MDVLLRVYRDRLAAVRARVAGSLTPLAKADPEAAARSAGELMDSEKAAAEARTSAPAPACTEGCSYCCHVNVEVTRPELIAIASHLRATLPEPALQAYSARLEAHVASMNGSSDSDRWASRLPCGLLDSAGRCTVYPVRPLRCRAFHSTSAEACRGAFDGTADAEPATNPSVERVLDAVEAGYDDALALAGLASTALRLESGLLAELDKEVPGRKFQVSSPCY